MPDYQEGGTRQAAYISRNVSNFASAYMGLFLMGFYCMEKEGSIIDIQLFDSVFLGSLIFGGAYPMFISGCLWSIIETNYEKLN